MTTNELNPIVQEAVSTGRHEEPDTLCKHCVNGLWAFDRDTLTCYCDAVNRITFIASKGNPRASDGLDWCKRTVACGGFKSFDQD